MTTAEHPLPAQQHSGAARKAEGFATPKQDKKPQCARMLPKRVLPIIFLPGIMGSNLRMSDHRQQELRRKDNIAWRPDTLGVTNINSAAKASPQQRQLQLDPLQTTVDIYDPSGPSDVSGDGRHGNVELDKTFRSPLLTADDPHAKNSRSAVQKVRARGWGKFSLKATESYCSISNRALTIPLSKAGSSRTGSMSSVSIRAFGVPRLIYLRYH
jgi:hypothetical protein